MSIITRKVKPLTLTESQWYEIQLGDLFFYVMKKSNVYWTSVDYQASTNPSMCKAIEPINKLPAHLEIKEKIYLPDSSVQPVITLQLADKPYEVNTAAVVKIAPQSRLILYVSTPLWLQVKEENEAQHLVEYPAVIPRLSWVGNNTTEGSLCYCTKSSAPSVFSEVKQYKHRALTALELINDGGQLLTIDRLSLPLNILSLYHSDAGGYWTESVRYRIQPETGETTIVAAKRPPAELGHVSIISKARDADKVNRFRTAMNLILG